MKKGILIGSIVLLASGFALWLYEKYGHPASNDNYKQLLKNLGANITPGSDGTVVIPFNSNQNTAQFYTNNRIVIFKGDVVLAKGNYSNGGFTITIDGKPAINGNSVYSNLLKTI